jgi:hypothetical protein
VRDAYGRNIYGQSLLLARRLVEAGTRLACILATRTPMAGGTSSSSERTLPPRSWLLDLLTDRRPGYEPCVVMGRSAARPKSTPGLAAITEAYTVLFAGGGSRVASLTHTVINARFPEPVSCDRQ